MKKVQMFDLEVGDTFYKINKPGAAKYRIISYNSISGTFGVRSGGITTILDELTYVWITN